MTAPGVIGRYRVVAGVVMAATLWMTISYTQTLFDQSDRRKAVALVLQSPDGGSSLRDALPQSTGATSPCTANIESSLAGTLTVICPTPSGDLRYKVDLLSKKVTPLDDLSAQAWRQRGGAPR